MHVIGPFISPHRRVARYGVAILFLLGVFGLRLALIPIMGTQAPLLPFILVVLGAGITGGRGPAVAVSLLAALLATLRFANWSDAPYLVAWSGHVTFFLLISLGVVLILGRLQAATVAARQAMLEAEKARAGAAAQEAHVRLIADGAPMLIAHADAEQRCTFANRTFGEWAGTSPDKTLGRNLSEVFGASIYALIQPSIADALAGRRSKSELELPFASGARQVSAHYEPDFGPEGSVRGVVALFEDITERRRSQEALRIANERKDEFLATLAHELRNPLASMRTIPFLLALEDVTAAQVKQCGAMLHRQVNILVRSVDDLLDASRISRGAISLAMEDVTIDSVLASALESVRPFCNSKRQSVTVTPPETSFVVHADPFRLCQVFGNLLTNAAKYSPDGSTIQVFSERSEDDVLVHVRDEGVGIDSEQLPRIFDLFKEANRPKGRLYDGIGVGLALAKTIVALHGGRLDARSDGVGHGSTFSVRLKVLRSDRASLPAAGRGSASSFDLRMPATESPPPPSS